MRSHAHTAIVLALALAGVALAGPASATLTSFQTYTGNVGYSSDGFGSVNQSGNISASVPFGSTVLAAYLYSATNSQVGLAGGTLNGTAVSYGPASINADSATLASQRVDVTSIMKPVIDSGVGGIYTFPITETSYTQDGEALVVVYSNSTLPTATFGILDGSARTTGDTTAINFASALHPSDPGFFAEMFLGDGFSCCDQKSTVKVNGTTITNSAGNNDDNIDGGSPANGSLITVGGFNDPYSPLLPSYANDHERYNLVPYITDGDTSITVNTINASNDDNIFLAGFYVSGEASINQPPPTGVPEPGSLGLFGFGLGALVFGLGWRNRRRPAA